MLGAGFVLGQRSKEEIISPFGFYLYSSFIIFRLRSGKVRSWLCVVLVFKVCASAVWEIRAFQMSSRNSLEETSSHLFSTAPHIWFQFAVRREMRCVIQVYEHSRLYIEMSIHTHARTLDAEVLNLLDSVK